MIGSPRKELPERPGDDLASTVGPHTPGYAFAILSGDIELFRFGGSACLVPEVIPVGEDTLFDLASLTKPLCTAMLALKASESGLLDLDESISGCRGEPFSALDLLRHEAGFPPWAPLYGLVKTPSEAPDWLSGDCPRDPPRQRAVYSCLGYILLGAILEEKLRAPMCELFKRVVAEPLGISSKSATFSPPPELKRVVAATEMDRAHEIEMATSRGSSPPPLPEGGLWGVANDGNARFLGGAAGNAGLFATCKAVSKLARAFLPESGFLGKRARELAFSSGLAAEGEIRTAGWKRSESPGWASGAALPAGCVGHEGFTGTGVWLDQRRGRVYVLLTNRIHPSHPGTDFAPVRARFLSAAQAAADDGKRGS